MPQLHPPTVGIACLSLLLVIYAPRIKGLARVPGPLVAMVIATALQAVLQMGTNRDSHRLRSTSRR